MELTHEKQSDVIVVTVKGRMDAVTAPDFISGLEDVISSGETKFVADLASLDYISSAGLRSLLVIAKKLKPLGGALVFCGVGGMVKEVFDISGFGSTFELYGTVQDAVSKLS